MNTLAGIRIIGERPDLYVELHEKRAFGRLAPVQGTDTMSAGQKEYLREQIKTYLLDLIAKSERESRSLKLPTLATQLKERFPSEPIYYKRLGFEKLSQLLRSFSEFVIEIQAGSDCLVRKAKPQVANQAAKKEVVQSKATSVEAIPEVSVKSTELSRKLANAQAMRSDLHTKVKSYIDAQLGVARQDGQLLEVSHLGDLLITYFPGERVYKLLGYKRLSDFLRSFSEYSLHTSGGKQVLMLADETPKWSAEVIENYTSKQVRTLEDGQQSPALPKEMVELRQDVEAFILEQTRRLHPSGKLLNVAALGTLLSKQFPGELIHRRLGFKKLLDLLNSIPDLEVQMVGESHMVTLKTPITSTP